MHGGVDALQRTADPVDALLVVAVPALMLTLGFLPGLLCGLLAASGHFLIMYSQTPILRVYSGADARSLGSNTVRSAAQRAILDSQLPRCVSLISLHGYLFFGSAPQLSHAVAKLLSAREAAAAAATGEPSTEHTMAMTPAAGRPWFVIVDLRHVLGVDFGTVEELVKLRAAIERAGGALRCAAPPKHVAAAIERSARGTLGRMLGFDETLRECEESVLRAHAPAGGAAAVALAGVVEASLLLALSPHLIRQPSADSVSMVRTLLQMGERWRVVGGQQIWTQTEFASFYVIVLSGEHELRRDGHLIEIAVPGAMLGFLQTLARGTRQTSLTCTSAGEMLVVSAGLHARLRKEQPRLERLLSDAMLTRLADEYRHWILHHAARADGPSRGSAAEPGQAVDLSLSVKRSAQRLVQLRDSAEQADV